MARVLGGPRPRRLLALRLEGVNKMAETLACIFILATVLLCAFFTRIAKSAPSDVDPHP